MNFYVKPLDEYNKLSLPNDNKARIFYRCQDGTNLQAILQGPFGNKDEPYLIATCEILDKTTIMAIEAYQGQKLLFINELKLGKGITVLKNDILNATIPLIFNVKNGAIL